MTNHDQTLISIVMPLYNAENYVGEAIESVLSQDYEAWELLVVDDASTDLSLSIVRRYSNHDSRIHITSLQTNSGVSHARNVALDKACGDYYCFLDADDQLGEGYLSELLQLAQSNRVQIVAFGTTIIDKDNRKLRVLSVQEKGLGFIGHPVSALQSFTPLYMWGYFIHRDLVSNIRFDETLALSEDRKFLAEVYMHASKSYATKKSFYFYRILGSSLTHQISCQAMVDAVEVDRDLFEQDAEQGFLNPGRDIYANRLLAAVRFIYKTREHRELLKTYRERLSILADLEGGFQGKLAMKYFIYRWASPLYWLASIFFTRNVKIRV